MVWLISGLLSRVFAPAGGPDAVGTPLEKRAQPEERSPSPTNKKKKRSAGRPPIEKPRPPSLEERTEAEVQAALDLRFESPSRGELIKRQQATTAEKLAAMLQAAQWGFRKGVSGGERILKAAARRLAFDAKVRKPWGVRTVQRWFAAFNSGGTVAVSRHDYTERTTLVQKYGEENVAVYFRRAMKVGDKMTWKQVSRHMYEESKKDLGEDRAIKLCKGTLHTWYTEHGGKDCADTERPFLTDDNCRARVTYYRLRQRLAAEGNINECHLDEKWFYIRTLRAKRKWLPPLPWEDPLVIRPRPARRKTKSRRFRTKIMYLGVVGKPMPQHNFCGKVCLERVAETKVAEKLSSHENFSDEIARCAAIKAGWRGVVAPTQTAAEMIASIVAAFPELDATKLKLTFQWTSQQRGGGEKQGSKDLPANKRPGDVRIRVGGRALVLADLTLKVTRAAGEEYVEDCNCDGEWMREVLEEKVGPAIRRAYHWVPWATPIRLQMDNAGERRSHFRSHARGRCARRRRIPPSFARLMSPLAQVGTAATR